MAVQGQSGHQTFEVGKLYYDRGDFKIAIEKLKKAANLFFEDKDMDLYLECQNLLLRMYGERGEDEKIMQVKEHLQDLALASEITLNSQTYYTLGVCASYRKQYEVGREHFQRALELALKEDNKKDMCHAILGLAMCKMVFGQNDEALKEIYNLNIFFEVIDLPALKMASQIVNGRILLNTGRPDEALEVFRKCYESLKSEKNIVFYTKTLCWMGVAYKELGDKNLAKLYLKLAASTVDPESLTLLHRFICEHLEEIGLSSDIDFDIVFNLKSGAVTEKRRGRIEFKNQFILLDLLHLFVKNPGKVFSKEELVEKVWKQPYNPSVHDNKVYVTIKRLRKLIEPDYDKPRYIHRGKMGYYLGKETRVLLEQ